GFAYRGELICYSMDGTITFNPPLVNGGNANVDTTTVTIDLSDCHATVPVVSGTMTGKIKSHQVHANDCAVLAQPVLPGHLVTKTAWTVAPGAKNASKTPASYLFGAVAGGNPIGFAGSAFLTKGSFRDNNAQLVIMPQETNADVAPDCAGAGLSTLHVHSNI